MLPGICSVGLGRGLVHSALTPSRCVGFGWWGPGDITGGAPPGAPARLAEESESLGAQCLGHQPGVGRP